MSGDRNGVSPAQEQLVALLRLLRAEGVEPGEALADSVMRTVRWQVQVRGTIVLIGDLIDSVAAALTLFGSSSPPAREEGE